MISSIFKICWGGLFIVSLSFFCFVQINNAYAQNASLLTCTNVIGTVDTKTGSVSLTDSTINNISKNNQIITEIVLSKLCDVDLDNATWKLNINNNIVYDGKINESNKLNTSLIICPNSSLNMNVQINNISSETAVSLIEKDVAKINMSFSTIQPLDITLEDMTNNDTPVTRFTHWCPVFDDGAVSMNELKFFDDNNNLIEGSGPINSFGVKTYTMNDLYNSLHCDNGLNYAFYKTGLNLNCFQVVDESWSSTFKEPINPNISPISTGLLDNFVSQHSDQPVNTIYFDNAYSDSWLPNNTIQYNPVPEPKIFNKPYSKLYEIYRKYEDKVLSLYSAYVWSPVVTNDIVNSRAIAWHNDTKVWDNSDNKYYKYAVVLIKTFKS